MKAIFCDKCGAEVMGSGTMVPRFAEVNCYWLAVGEEQMEFQLCYDCARKMISWVKGEPEDDSYPKISF